MLQDKYNFDMKFQQLILALFLRESNFLLGQRSVIHSHFFENPIHQEICNHLLKYFDKYKILPTSPALKEMMLESVKGESVIHGHLQELMNLYKVNLEDKDFVKDKCVEFAKHQALKVAILDSVDHLEKGNYGRIKKAVEDALKVGEDMLNLGRLYIEEHGCIQEGEDVEVGVMRNYVPTMWKQLDATLRGGLYKKQLGVIMAPAKVGKSATLVNLGATAIQMGRKVFHYTLELGTEFLCERYDSRISGIQTEDLRGSAKEIRSKIDVIKARKGEAVIKEYPTRHASVSTIRAHIENVRASKQLSPDLIIVDYGDLLKSTIGYGDNRYRELGSVFEELRALAFEYDIPVWTATQSNRAAAEKPIIRLQDIAESYEKVMVADIIIALCQTAEEKQKEELRMFVAGNRTGHTGAVIRCKFHPKQMILREA